MIGLENSGETLIFMSRHFDETKTILISHFLCSGALKFLTGDYFVLRTNKITCSKQKMGWFIHFSIFLALFPQHILSIHLYRVAYNDVWINLHHGTSLAIL